MNTMDDVNLEEENKFSIFFSTVVIVLFTAVLWTGLILVVKTLWNLAH